MALKTFVDGDITDMAHGTPRLIKPHAFEIRKVDVLCARGGRSGSLRRRLGLDSDISVPLQAV